MALQIDHGVWSSVLAVSAEYPHFADERGQIEHTRTEAHYGNVDNFLRLLRRRFGSRILWRI